MKRMAWAACAAWIAACSGSEGGEGSGAPNFGESPQPGVIVKQSVEELPSCDADRDGMVYYALSTAQFFYCDAEEGEHVAFDLHGQDGSSCTVLETEGLAVITCDDGTRATVSDGAEGAPGAPGPQGPEGPAGQDGQSCAATRDEENRVVTISCPGQPDVTVYDGASGADGQDGSSCSVMDNGDGTKTISCDDGTSVTVSDGAPGADGQDGSSCSVTDNGDGTKTVACTDGTEVTVSDGRIPSPCDSDPCQNGGLCSAVFDDAVWAWSDPVCECPLNFNGEFCETAQPPDPCDDSPCLNNGACVSDFDFDAWVWSGPTCDCVDGYTGGSCQIPPPAPRDPTAFCDFYRRECIGDGSYTLAPITVAECWSIYQSASEARLSCMESAQGILEQCVSPAGCGSAFSRDGLCDRMEGRGACDFP